ncbi:MAG: WXG100 family type VII secretion target, partial [Actinomycetota bacterium]|nr:WXG100 family type VII secretion target [Actinomycetota bacterium]
MSTIGAEIPQLESLKGTFDRQSQAVQELTSNISNQLGNTWWKGPAADRFRSEWSSEFEPMLRRLQQSLQESGAEVGRRREALVQA